MKVLHFTIPVPANNNIILQEESGSHFYPHLHRHHEMQLTWIQQGEGTLVINNEMHSFGAGDLYCIGANQAHVFKNDPSYFTPKSKKRIRALTIFFNPEAGMKGLFSLEEFAPIKNMLIKFNAGFCIPAESTSDIGYQMEKLFKKTGVELLVSFIELLRLVTQNKRINKLAHNDGFVAVSENDGLIIGQIYHHVMMNYDKPISLKEIAVRANMTPPAFCRYFKKRTAKTFVAFLNEVRINEACQKLVKENFESISLVAYNCGFNSVTHFNRIFKTSVGKSPSEYLKAYHLKAYKY